MTGLEAWRKHHHRITPYLFRLAVSLCLAAILASCNATLPQPEGTPIAFRTPDNWGGTRLTADKDGKDQFENDDRMGIFADHITAAGGGKKSFMENQMAEYYAGQWTYNPVKYWPTTAGEQLQFFAYHPYQYQKTAIDGRTVTLALDGHTPLLHAETGQLEPQDAAVALQFRHLLHRVCFSFVPGTDYRDVGKVVSVTVTNTKTRATLDVEAGTPTFDRPGPITLHTVLPVDGTESGYLYFNPTTEPLNLTIRAEKKTYLNVPLPLDRSSDSGGNSYHVTLKIHGDMVTFGPIEVDTEWTDTNIELDNKKE